MRLTKQTVASLALPRGKAEFIVFDEDLPGFGVRLRDGARATWIAQYRMGAKQRRMTLGKVDTVKVDLAREKAKTILAQVQLGADPQADRTGERDRSAVTLASAGERYQAHAKARMKARSFEEIERHCKIHLKQLAREPVHKIDRARVALLLNEIAEERGPIAANRVRSTLSAFFTWAMREGIADANPVIATNKAKEKARERSLTAAELKKVWKACGEDDYGKIVRLLILTGQRRAEVAGMAESELDRKQSLWRLPTARTKNSLLHEVPLSDAALAELPEQREEGARDMLFGVGDGPFSGWSIAKSRLDERCGVSGWTLHDLRRTAATGMADIGVQPHIIEAVLNHISGTRAGVAGIYNRAQYAPEKRQALDRWAEHVTALVAGKASNVVPLARA